MLVMTRRLPLIFPTLSPSRSPPSSAPKNPYQTSFKITYRRYCRNVKRTHKKLRAILSTRSIYLSFFHFVGIIYASRIQRRCPHTPHTFCSARQANQIRIQYINYLRVWRSARRLILTLLGKMQRRKRRRVSTQYIVYPDQMSVPLCVYMCKDVVVIITYNVRYTLALPLHLRRLHHISKLSKAFASKTMLTYMDI